MNTPKRIQRKRTRGWSMPEGAVYVGRPTGYGNPYIVRKSALGFVIDWKSGGEHYQVTPDGKHYETREQALVFAVRLYRTLFMICELDEIRGKDLACWCHLCEEHKDGKPYDVDCPNCAPCHANVLLELANR